MVYLQSSVDGMAALMADVGLRRVTGSASDPELPPIPDGWDFDGTDLASEHRSLSEFKERLAMAVFGGVTLVGPVVVMSIWGTKVICLSVTASSVAVVAVILAWFMKEAQPKDVIAATAAYAAVLVVFVGASPGSST